MKKNDHAPEFILDWNAKRRLSSEDEAFYYMPH